MVSIFQTSKPKLNPKRHNKNTEESREIKLPKKIFKHAMLARVSCIPTWAHAECVIFYDAKMIVYFKTLTIM